MHLKDNFLELFCEYCFYSDILAILLQLSMWTPFYIILLNLPAVSPTVKGRTNLKIKEKYLSPAGSSAKGLTVSRSNSSLSLYSSASAPTSPMTRKASQKVCAVTAGNIYYFFKFFCSFVCLNPFFSRIKYHYQNKLNNTSFWTLLS